MKQKTWKSLPKSYTCSTLSWDELSSEWIHTVSCAIKINSHLIPTEIENYYSDASITYPCDAIPFHSHIQEGLLCTRHNNFSYWILWCTKNIHLVINDDGEKEDDWLYGMDAASSIYMRHCDSADSTYLWEWVAKYTRNFNDFISHKRTRGDNSPLNYCNLNLRGAYCASCYVVIWTSGLLVGFTFMDQLIRIREFLETKFNTWIICHLYQRCKNKVLTRQ